LVDPNHRHHQRASNNRFLFRCKTVLFLPLETRSGTERGDLIQDFLDRLTPDWNGKRPLTFSYLVFRLTGLSKDDLYYLRSLCDQESRRGVPYGKVFFGAIKAR
jgi:hypothetical protein